MWVWVEEERDIRILVHIGANIGAYWYILVFDKDEDALMVGIGVGEGGGERY